MSRNRLVGLSESECNILLIALSKVAWSSDHKSLVDAVIAKLEEAEAAGPVTVFVHGGKVQWPESPLFPLRGVGHDPDDVEPSDHNARASAGFLQHQIGRAG